MANKESQESLFRRLTRLFRSGPVVKRKIRSADTNIIVPDRTKSSGAMLFQKSMSPTYATITSNAYNLSERLTRYQDFQEMEYCLDGATRIAQLDGYKTIAELAKECEADPDHKFLVYSYDHGSKKIVPAWGKQARLTRVDHAWKVTFDSGKEIIGSANHRLMLRDGSYKKIEDLHVGDSMMPFYRKDLFEDADNPHGYQWVYTMDPENSWKGWTKEHRLVAEWVLGRSLVEGEVVHHKNFVRHDNRPDNLEVMSEADHGRLHAEILNGKKWSNENTEWIESFKRKHSIVMRENNPSRRSDVTFGKILQECEENGFSRRRLLEKFDIDSNLLSSRLREKGIPNWETFVRAYSTGVYTDIDLGKVGINDLSLDLILSQATSDDTKSSLAIKLGCTVNVLDKFLDSRLGVSWVQFRLNNGWVNEKENNRRGGRPKGAVTHHTSFQDLCNAYKPGMSRRQLADKVGITWNQVMSLMTSSGFKRFSDWTSQHSNHKVVSIEYVGEIPLYDLTVDGYKNFATDTVISHNTAEIASALDIYADETVAQDDKGRVLHVYSDNPKIKSILEDLFYNTLNVEFNLRPWARNLVKFGDFFLYNDVSPTEGVINAFPIPVNELEREENYDKSDPSAVRFRWVTLGNRILENWEVTHMRLLGNDMFLPYGSSVIEPARRIWRQLILIEDAMLVYRVVRAPERRVFYIDVGGLPAEAVPAYIEDQKRVLKSSQVIDRQTGRVDVRYNPMSVEEDYFLPVRGGESGTKIDTLAGGQNAAAVEDVQYIQKKLFAALKVPKAYLGYDEALSSKATLAQEDVRFSRTISVIQKTIIAELNKLAIIHLYSHGYDADDLVNFTLRLSNPSTVAQMQKLELWKSRFEIASAGIGEGMTSKTFVRKEVLGLTDEQILAIDSQRYKEKIVESQIEAAQPEVEEVPESEASSQEPETPETSETGESEAPAENASEETDDDLELLTSNEENKSLEFSSVKHSGRKKSPVKVSASSKLAYDAKRRSKRKRYDGAAALSMPNLYDIATNSTSLSDPHDMSWLKGTAKNPFSESTVKPTLPNDLIKTLGRMSGTNRGTNGIIAEDLELEFDDKEDDRT